MRTHIQHPRERSSAPHTQQNLAKAVAADRSLQSLPLARAKSAVTQTESKQSEQAPKPPDRFSRPVQPRAFFFASNS